MRTGFGVWTKKAFLLLDRIGETVGEIKLLMNRSSKSFRDSSVISFVEFLNCLHVPFRCPMTFFMTLLSMNLNSERDSLSAMFSFRMCRPAVI